jgi:mannose-6-phosphate isomerase
MGPLRFAPLLKPLVWGGRLLGDRLGRTLPTPETYGESWDISDHTTHASVVDWGPLAGQSLRDLMLQSRREMLGAAAESNPVFPWLVKHLDAHDWLSVQVHPDDLRAARLRPGERGKTEVWYVLDAKPGSRIYAGLKPGIDEDTLRAALAAGTVADCLHSFAPKLGDCVFLPAGTVHAVGGGVLMAEIQQTSDVTFRLFDWNRRDARGQSRPLHIDEAFACIDWQQGPVEPVSAPPGGRKSETVLASCGYFHLALHQIDEPVTIGGQGQLQLLLPLAGTGTLQTDHGPQAMVRGQCWLLPAACPPLTCTPRGSLAFLWCSLP